MIGGAGLVISDLLFRFLPAESRRWPYVFVLLYWAYMIPAMFVRRVLYLYHYLPPLILGIILFALVLGLAARLSWRTRRDVLLLSIAWVVVGYLVYRPLTAYGPLTNEQFQRLNVWPAWDLRCEVREQLLAWLQQQHPGALPRVRAELEAPAPQQLEAPAPERS